MHARWQRLGRPQSGQRAGSEAAGMGVGVGDRAGRTLEDAAGGLLGDQRAWRRVRVCRLKVMKPARRRLSGAGSGMAATAGVSGAELLKAAAKL